MDELLFKPRKRIRLPDSSYTVPGTVWHVTFGVENRDQRPFANVHRARAIADTIEGTPEFTGSPVHFYCLMPDHAHLILEVRDKSLVKLVSSIKIATTKTWWGVGGNGKLWQKSFYDHGIRGPQDYDATVAYILGNPVKSGLVEAWEHYPLIGGDMIESADPS